MSDLNAVFGKPFAHQIAALRIRLAQLKISPKWTDLWQAEHDRAFMVAGAMKADLLADLAAAVDRAITEHRSIEEFRRDFRAIVERRGWHGWTGEGTAKGEAWRTKVIYRTNMATSYAAGRMAQLTATNWEFWVYKHGNAREPRLQHLAWDGVALPPDHPFWADHAPPNGWGCTCRIRGADSAAGVRRAGGDPDKTLPAGWQSVNPKTGAPIGIDKGWAYAPGRSVASTVNAMTEKSVAWPYELNKAFMSNLPDGTKDAFSDGYRQLPSLAGSIARYSEKALLPGPVLPELDRYRGLGLLTSRHVTEVTEASGTDVRGYDYVLDVSSIRHTFKEHGPGMGEEMRGQIALEPSDFALIAQILVNPDQLEPGGRSDIGRPIVRFTKRIGGVVYHVSFEVLGKRKMLLLKSMWKRRAPGDPPA